MLIRNGKEITCSNECMFLSSSRMMQTLSYMPNNFPVRENVSEEDSANIVKHNCENKMNEEF